MPPLERRSPSSLGSCTSRRSFSILIGSLSPSAVVGHGATVPSGPCRWKPYLLATADGLTLEGEPSCRASRGARPWSPTPIRCTAATGGTASWTRCSAEPFTTPGWRTVRFDFRGVGRSRGRARRRPSRAARRGRRARRRRAVRGRRPRRSWRATRSGAGRRSTSSIARLDRLARRGASARPRPARDPLASADHRPKLLLVPEHDQFSPPAVATRPGRGLADHHHRDHPDGRPLPRRRNVQGRRPRGQPPPRPADAAGLTAHSGWITLDRSPVLGRDRVLGRVLGAGRNVRGREPRLDLRECPESRAQR